MQSGWFLFCMEAPGVRQSVSHLHDSFLPFFSQTFTHMVFNVWEEIINRERMKSAR